ncbi:MAG: sigma-70 family RNA polymerase sigma factor [Planctomycetota bacterium]|nr:sigma-70 family RNA polymerase sigma factor [Planctomycetota bacterium]
MRRNRKAPYMTISAKQTFEILVREHSDMLRAFIFSLVRDRDLADELFQETFITAWKKLDSYDRKRPFGAWLRGIAAMHLMAKKRQISTSRLYYFDEETIVLLENRFAGISRYPGDTWQEKLDVLEKCIKTLPEPSQQLLSLYYHENYTCKEIASKVGASVEKIKKSLQRMRQALYECIYNKLGTTAIGDLQ